MTTVPIAPDAFAVRSTYIFRRITQCTLKKIFTLLWAHRKSRTTEHHHNKTQQPPCTLNRFYALADILYYRHLSAIIFMEINKHCEACSSVLYSEICSISSNSDSRYICSKRKTIITFCYFKNRKIYRPKRFDGLLQRRAETDRRLRLRTPAYYASLTTNKIALKQNQRTIRRYAVLSGLCGWQCLAGFRRCCRRVVLRALSHYNIRLYEHFTLLPTYRQAIIL